MFDGPRLLGLAVQRVLAEDGIVLLELKPPGCVATILHRRIAGRARSFRALQRDFVAYVLSFGHCSALIRLNFDALLTGFFQYSRDSLLVDRLDRLCRDTERDPPVFFGNVEPLFLQVRLETAFRLVVRMGNVVARNGALP